MTNSTLVLISESTLAREFCDKSEACCLGTLNGKSLLVCSRTLTLPARQFLLRQHTRNSLHDWHRVLDELRALAGPHGLILIDYEHTLRELMLLGLKDGHFNYGVFVSRPIERVATPDYAILGSAVCVLAPDQDALDSLTKLYVAPFEGQLIGISASRNCLQVLQKRRALLPPIPESTSTAPKRALLVSYFAGPCKTVGVQRVNYWSEELARTSDETWDVHLATSIQWRSRTGKVHHVPDLYVAALVADRSSSDDDSGEFLSWAADYIENEEQDAKHINTLGYYWRFCLETYFDNLPHHYDAVIISGNPFSVFDFANYAKRKWYAKVLLDYRDPFSNNPRMLYSDEARAYAQHVERGFNFQSDICIAVNDVCLNLLEGRADTPAVVIPNGYDERVIEYVKEKRLESDIINFVYAGSFYHNSPPDAFIHNLDPTKHRLHHIGKTTGVDGALLEQRCLTVHGVKSYLETLQIIGLADCGLVYMSQSGFETPTKFFDYAAFGMDILVCTEAPLRTGALAGVLADYPGAHWCRNTPEGIAEFLSTYQPSKQAHYGKARYTRRYGSQLLFAQLDALCPEITGDSWIAVSSALNSP